MRRLALLAMVTVLSMGLARPAQASVWTGSCSLILTFNFQSRVFGVQHVPFVSTPSYSISVAPAADLNPLTGTAEACVISLGGLNPFRTTSVTAGGSSSIWSCTSTLASGSWTQGWNSSPPTVVGSHIITGGPDAWTMTVHNWPTMNFVGTMKLAVHPNDALKLAQCEVSSITSLKMIGVMEFQDP